MWMGNEINETKWCDRCEWRCREYSTHDVRRSVRMGFMVRKEQNCYDRCLISSFSSWKSVCRVTCVLNLDWVYLLYVIGWVSIERWLWTDIVMNESRNAAFPTRFMSRWWGWRLKKIQVRDISENQHREHTWSSINTSFTRNILRYILLLWLKKII